MNYFLSYTYRITVFVFCCFLSASAIDIASIKGTYKPLKDSAQHMSPLFGAIWWESGLVRNYYDFGYIKSEKPENRWLAEGDGLIRLISALFYSVEGSFDISASRNLPAAHMSARTIARLIAYCEKTRKEDRRARVDEIVEIVGTDPDVLESIKASKSMLAQIRSEYGVRRKHIIKQLESIEKIPVYTQKFGHAKVEQQEKLLQLLESARALAPHKDSLQMQLADIAVQEQRAVSDYLVNQVEKPKSSQFVREFAQALVDSSIGSPYYIIPYSHYCVLLAFMYRKARTKQDFLDYFNVLSGSGIDLFEKPLEQAWLNEVFSNEQVETIKRKIQDDLHARVPLQSIVKDHLEDLVFAQIQFRYYMQDFPKKAGYISIAHHNTHFPDCAETLLRNVCNSVLYDKLTGKFDIRNAPQKNLEERCQEFYKQHDKAVAVESYEAHTSWANVVGNIPYVTYNRAITRRSDGSYHVEFILAGAHEAGFIRGIPPSVLGRLEHKDRKVKIGDQWYIPVEDSTDVYLCEMRTSITNFIIMMNHLFNLRIFSESLEQAFLKPAFNATYLPKLFSSLRILSDCTTNMALVDSDDYTIKTPKIQCKDFTIALQMGHAELIVPEPVAYIVSDDVAREFIKYDMRLLPLFASYTSIMPSAFSYPYFFFIRMNTVRDAAYIIELISKNLFNNADTETQMHLLRLVERLILYFPVQYDLYDQIALISALQQSTALCASLTSAIKIILGSAYNQAVDLGADWKELCKFAQKIYVLCPGCAAEVFKLTQEAIKHVPYNAAMLLIRLVDSRYNESYAFAKDIAHSLVAQDNIGLRSMGLQLFQMLVNAKQEDIYELALKQAVASMEYDAKNASNLFAALIETHKEFVLPVIYAQAVNVIEKIKQGHNAELFDAGHILLVSMIKNKFDPAYKMIIDLFIQDKYKSIDELVDSCFEELLLENNKMFFDLAEQAARLALKQGTTRLKALQFYRNIIQRMKTFDVDIVQRIIQAIAPYALSTSEEEHRLVMQILEIIIEKNMQDVFGCVGDIAYNLCKSSDDDKQGMGFELFAMLTKKGAAYDRAERAVHDILLEIPMSDSYTIREALYLLRNLVAAGHAHDLARQVIEKYKAQYPELTHNIEKVLQ